MCARMPPSRSGRPRRRNDSQTTCSETSCSGFSEEHTPDAPTIARLVFVPLVLLLFYLDLRWWALGVFVAAVCTDFIDGALARTRNQITPVGTLLDPLADKLLVVAVLALIGHKYLVVQIMLAFIVLELVVSLIGGSILLRTRESRPANVFGKIKMVIQSIALFFFILSGILELRTGLTISIYLLWERLLWSSYRVAARSMAFWKGAGATNRRLLSPSGHASVAAPVLCDVPRDCPNG